MLVKILCGVLAPTLAFLYYQVTILDNVIAPVLRRNSSCGHYSPCHGSGTCLCCHNGDDLASAAFWDHFCDVAASLLRSLACLLPWALASTDSLQVVSAFG